MWFMACGLSALEGCNAINVSVLFVAFLFAYKGSLKSTMIFALLGLLAIYIFNLLRVAGLFLVARFYPEQLYLMHKFVFTGTPGSGYHRHFYTGGSLPFSTLQLCRSLFS